MRACKVALWSCKVALRAKQVAFWGLDLGNVRGILILFCLKQKCGLGENQPQAKKPKNIFIFGVMIKLIFPFFSLFILNAYCQIDTSKMVVYSKGYKFNDGVYMSYKDFKNNHPVYGLITRDAITEQVSKNGGASFCIGKVLYMDSTINRVEEMETDKVWGICFNGIPYIHKGINFGDPKSFIFIRKGCFYPIRSIGKLCHVVKTTNIPASSSIGRPNAAPNGFPTFSSPVSSDSKTKHTQYVLEMYSGTLFSYSDLLIYEILKQKDQELFREFDEAWTRQKREGLGFYYMTKFNERHPLYLPKNQ